MNMNKLFLLGAALLAISCVNEIVSEDQNNEKPQVKLVPVTFQAGSEDDSESDTKVTLGGEEHKIVLWTESDQIKVFDKTEADLPAFTVSSGAGTNFAEISGSVSAEASGNYYAMYPYQAEATFTNETTMGTKTVVDGYITMVVPAEQKAVAGSVDPAAFLGVGQCTNGTTFNFYNATAFVRFRLDPDDVEDLETVSFSGNELGSVAGKINIGFNEKGNVEQTIVSGVQYVTLSKPDVDGWKSGVDYYFAIRPLKFETGFTITAKYADGSCRHLTTTKGVTNDKGEAQTVSRNCTMNLGKMPKMKSGLPNDLYIAYLHGQNIDIAGNIVNKTDYPSATLVTTDKTIQNGVFFVNPGITATIKNLKTSIIIGRMADTKSLAARTDSYLRITPSANEDYLMMKNISLNLNHAGTQAYLAAIAADGTFEKIVFDDCKIEIPSEKTQLINALKNRQINECVFESCDIKLNNSPAYLINYASSKGSENSTTVTNLNFHNNIVYAASDIQQFEIFYGKWAPITTLSVTNNIFFNTYCTAEGYVFNNKTVNFTLQNNIFYMPKWGEYAVNASGTFQYWGFLKCHGDDAANGKTLANYPAEGKATANNNYCYKTSGYTFKTSFADMKNGSTYYSGVANPTNGTTDPFTTKDLTTPSFTLDNAYQKYIGATR